MRTYDNDSGEAATLDVDYDAYVPSASARVPSWASLPTHPEYRGHGL